VTSASLGGQIARQVGQRGVPKVRRLVRRVSGGERSAAERVLTGLLREAGMTGWRTNAPIRDERGLFGMADLVFDAERVVVEVDGWAHHNTVDRFQRDRTRQTGSCATAGPCCASPGAT
jgi:very-short-patch-repair endonuclease